MRSTTSLPASSRRRLLLLAVGAVALSFATAGAIIWLVWFSSQAPVAASIDEAAGALESAAPSTTASPDASHAPGATDDGAAAPADGADGTWTVDSSIGSFADYTSSYAGFRVDEVLTSIGSTTAVGRTPDVSGSLTIADGSLTSAAIEVDLTTIRSDQSRRDPAIQRALETASFPTATFTLTTPVALSDEADSGETLMASVAGDLTIHGVTVPVTLNLDASLVNGVIVAVGSIDVTFTDFGVVMPTAPIVVSVQENGQIEFQLFFSPG